jgi:hypothetical protein
MLELCFVSSCFLLSVCVIVCVLFSIYHTKNPQWTQTFMLNYEYGSECYFYVQVFRYMGNNNEPPISMGNCVCEIGDILGTRNSTKVKRLPKGGA